MPRWTNWPTGSWKPTITSQPGSPTRQDPTVIASSSRCSMGVTFSHSTTTLCPKRCCFGWTAGIRTMATASQCRLSYPHGKKNTQLESPPRWFCISTGAFVSSRRSSKRGGKIETPCAGSCRAHRPLSCSIPSSFSPFRRRPGDFDIEDRIIAPVTDKSEGLKQDFVRAAYRKACGFVRASGTVVAIGYSFNPHDQGSYRQLL